MEAALRLFYGFQHVEPYAFKHQRANLQVSAEIEIDGTPRSFTRLPKRSGNLVNGHGNALPEAALAAHLGGMAEEDYRNLLCLDDATIERGRRGNRAGPRRYGATAVFRSRRACAFKQRSGCRAHRGR